MSAYSSQSLPSIPKYYRDHVDPQVDLSVTPSIPCIFHNETHGRSFSYKAGSEIWRCFGACHCGGDVIDLHRHHYKLRSREEATKSLYRLYGLHYDPVRLSMPKAAEPDRTDAYRRRVYEAALRLAVTPDDWIQLDYIVSKVPYSVTELELFCNDRGFYFESQEVTNVSSGVQ